MNRQEYDIIKAKFPGRIVVPGYLRTDYTMVPGEGTTKFILKKGEKTQLMPERLLDDNDAFAITNYGIFLLFETVGKEGVGKLETYPNATVFTGTGIVAADLEKVYNGSLGIKLDQDQLIESYPAHNFRVVRTTQQATSTTKSEQLPVDGYATATPMLVLYGGQKIFPQLDRPAVAGEGVQLADQTVNVVKVSLCLQGFTVYGAGKDKYGQF